MHFSEWNEIMVVAVMTLIEIQQCALCLVFVHAYASTIEFNDAPLNARRLQMFCRAYIAHTYKLNAHAHTIHCLMTNKKKRDEEECCSYLAGKLYLCFCLSS